MAHLQRHVALLKLAVALGVFMASLTGAPVAHAQQTVTLEEGRILAARLTSIGQPAAAREIALGLLQADPTDVQALVALSRAELALRRYDAALVAARTAKNESTDAGEHYLAALAMADVMAQTERFTRSQIWLRRAIQSAPNPQSERVAVEAYRRVRQLNPLSIDLDFGLTPSSNVNSGNSNDRYNLAWASGDYFGTPLNEIYFNTPVNERPLSGLEISLQADLQYRLTQTETSRTSLEFGVFGRTYIMSDSARETAPDVTGESLSYAQASIGVLHQWRPEGADAPYSASLTYSYDWAGGTPYRYEVNATLGTQFTLTERDRLTLLGAARYSHGVTRDTDTMIYSLRGTWSRALSNDDTFGISTQLAKATSETTDLAYDDISLGVSYDFGDLAINNTPLGVDLVTSYTEQYRVYESSAFDPAGREDRISALRFDMGFNTIDVYGFQPVVTLQARRTDSSIQRFDTEGGQLGLNLRSSF